jgi:hypothetical protein
LAEHTELGFYEVTAQFTEEAIITLVAPSEESAATLVQNQYADKLKDFVVTGVTFKEKVAKDEGVSLQ